MKKFIIMLFILQLFGCGRISIHNYKAHDETEMGKNKITILHITRDNYVREIDGKGKYSPDHVSDLFPYSGAKIELLPGTHTLAMEYRSSTLHSTGKSNLKFKFLPGKQYFLHSSTEYKAKKSGSLGIYILYKIHECGTKQETEYNKTAKEKDFWLAPYVPACGV